MSSKRYHSDSEEYTSSSSSSDSEDYTSSSSSGSSSSDSEPEEFSPQCVKVEEQLSDSDNCSSGSSSDSCSESSSSSSDSCSESSSSSDSSPEAEIQYIQGPPGPPGPPGPSGSQAFLNSYSFLTHGNTQDLKPGEEVVFALNSCVLNQIGRCSATGILIPEIGSYLVFYQLTALGAGHLVLCLNGVEQLHTIVAKGACCGQVVCGTIVTTEVNDTILSVRNPVKANSTLRITANEGGPLGVSNHITLVKLG